jgi:MIP family channel proteins
MAELAGTFALVFLSAGVVCANKLPRSLDQPQPFLVGIALAQGFILAAMLSATCNVSGGFLNPAVTLTLWVFKQLDGARTLGLILAQALGAVLAGLCVRLIFSELVLRDTHCGAPHLNLPAYGLGENAVPSLDVLLSGIGVELILTFILTFAIFGSILDPRAPRLGGLGAGFALTAAVLMGFTLTGAAVNPARWFGPVVWEATLVEGAFNDHAVYWIGPVLGALLAGGIYVLFIAPSVEERPAMGAPHAPGPLAGAAPPAKVKK